MKGCEGVDWIHLTRDRVQHRPLGNQISGYLKRGEFRDYLSDY